MNQRFDLDVVLDEWMRDGPDSGPDRVIDRVADQIDRVPQQRAWRLHGRSPFMTRIIQVAVALAAAVAIVFGGYSLLPRSAPGIGGVTPTESPVSTLSSPGPSPIVGVTPDPSAPSWVTTTPDPSMTCEDNIVGCAGLLAAGFHRSWQLEPRLWYSVPFDNVWSNSIDSPGIFKLDYGANRLPYILIWVNPGIAVQTPSCMNVGARPGGRDAAAWKRFLTTEPGLVASDPIPVDLVGSADRNAFEIDVTLSPTWTTMCGDWPHPMIPFISRDGDPNADYGVDATGRVHMMVVDAGSVDQPSTMVIQVYGAASDQATFESYIKPAERVMETFRFGCGPSVGYGPCGPGSELPSPSPSGSAQSG